MAVAAVDWNATGSMVGGVASAITAGVAVVAAIFAWRQVQEVRRLNAEDAYLAFHRMSFENPEYANPNYGQIRRNSHGATRYHWFVIGMLVTIERIITILPRDEEWKAAVLDDLVCHCDYLCSDEFEPFIRNFSPHMQRFLGEFIDSRRRTDARDA